MAVDIFDNLFHDVFDRNKYQIENGKVYITKEQYEAEMRAMGEEDDFDEETQ